MSGAQVTRGSVSGVSALPILASTYGVVSGSSADQTSALLAFFAAIPAGGVGILPANTDIKWTPATAPTGFALASNAKVMVEGATAYPNHASTRLVATADTTADPDTVWALTLNSGAQCFDVGFASPTVYSPAGGVRPCRLGGVLMNSSTRVSRPVINGFSSGIGMRGDHIYIYDPVGQNNGWGFNILPAGTTGNYYITNTRLFGNLATIGVASSSFGLQGVEIDGGHAGVGPGGIYRYYDGLGDSQTFINGLTLNCVAFESCKQFVYFDECLTGKITGDNWSGTSGASVNNVINGTADNEWWATGTASGMPADLAVTAVNTGSKQITVTQAGGFVIRPDGPLGVTGMVATDPSGNNFLPASTRVTGIVSGTWPTGSMVLQLNNTPNASLTSVRLANPQLGAIVSGDYVDNHKYGGTFFHAGYGAVPTYFTNFFHGNTDDGEPTGAISDITGGRPFLSQHVGVNGTQEAWGNLFGQPHGSRGSSFTIQKVATGQTVAQYDVVERVYTVPSGHGVVVQPATGASKVVGVALRGQTAGGPVEAQVAGKLVTVSNKTGVSISAGALVKVDTVNAGGVTTATSMSDGIVIGVATEAISGAATGRIELWEQTGGGGGSGSVPATVVQLDSGTAPTVDHLTALTDQAAWYYDQASGKVKGTAFLAPPAPQTDGDLWYVQGGTLHRLAIGSAGQFVGVSSGLPAWATPAFTALQVGGSTKTARTKLNLIAGTNVTITEADNAGADSGDVTIAASGGGSSHAAPWSPLDNAWTGASFDPGLTSGGTSPGVNTLQVIKVIALQATTLTTLLLDVFGAGATLTANQNLAGVYNAGGTLIGTVPDQSTAWQSVGAAPATLTVVGGQSLAVTVGQVLLVGVYSQGTTLPSLARGSASANVIPAANYNLAATAYRFGSANIGAGQTALPSTLPTLVAGAAAFFAGLI